MIAVEGEPDRSVEPVELVGQIAERGVGTLENGEIDIDRIDGVTMAARIPRSMIFHRRGKQELPLSAPVASTELKQPLRQGQVRNIGTLALTIMIEGVSMVSVSKPSAGMARSREKNRGS